MVYCNQPLSTMVDHYWPWLTMVDLDWPSCSWLTLVVDDWHFTVSAIVELSIFLLLHLTIVNLLSTFVLNDNGHDNTNISPYLCPSPPSSFVVLNNNTHVSSSSIFSCCHHCRDGNFLFTNPSLFAIKATHWISFNVTHEIFFMLFMGMSWFPISMWVKDPPNFQTRVFQSSSNCPHQILIYP